MTNWAAMLPKRSRFSSSGHLYVFFHSGAHHACGVAGSNDVEAGVGQREIEVKQYDRLVFDH
ncbi:hypothetical protein [Mesorhizobium sp. B2-3-15]|uniref:hypothetical protein n=1 Tax=Mesorhizobium sp. B2-3-15 TaxID=2589949 RepID=UPI00112BBC73|nr:hypothetical protein [Mesorhizobium sp. B2-3-15]TPL74062.1 hypothetical protein FJ954_09975 [Mesorhizobium sp. B2-3-15]